MLDKKNLIVALIGLTLWGPAHATLSIWSSGNLMIVSGSAVEGDVTVLKERLTPAIKTVVVRNPTGSDWSVGRALANVIEAANVTTVAHGNCDGFACPMMFLAGKQRMFSGEGPATAHAVTLLIGESAHVMNPGPNQVTLDTIHAWWRDHSKLTRDDTSQYHDSWFYVVPQSSKFDRKVFAPSQSKFSKGNVVHCSGYAKSQQLVDCMSVPNATSLNRGIVTTDELFVDARLKEAADILTLQATGIAAIDADPVAAISDKCKEMYKDFLRQDLPRAFVVNSAQGCNWTSLGFRARERALVNCKKTEGVECRFYTIDNEVVFTPFNKPVPAATAIPLNASSSIELLVLDQQNTTLLLARSASKENGPSGVNDQFSVEGRVVAYLTFKWDTVRLKGGKQSIEIRWFNADKLITSQKNDIEIFESPQRTWQSVLAADLGVGSAHVDIYSNGKLIANKAFFIAEKL